MSAPPVITEELVRFCESGLSIAIGTRDATLAPEGARIWAVAIDADRIHLDAFAYAPAVGPTLANLEANAQMALVLDQPLGHRACQLKGTFVGWRPGRDDERALVERQFAGLCDSLEAIGIARKLYEPACRRWPVVALRMRITDAFRQDPGPGAGERLR